MVAGGGELGGVGGGVRLGPVVQETTVAMTRAFSSELRMGWLSSVEEAAVGLEYVEWLRSGPCWCTRGRGGSGPGLAVGTDVFEERGHDLGEVVPGVDLSDLDAGGFDDVGTVGEKDGVNVVRKAEDVAAGGPGGEGGGVEFVEEVGGFDAVGEVDEADVGEWAGEDAADEGLFRLR